MSIKSWVIAPVLAAFVALALASNAQAGTARLILESDAPMGAGSEFAQMSYASAADLIANNPTSSNFLPTEFARIYSVGDIAYDNGAYRFLIESNFDLPGGRELFILTYDSWADVLTNSFSPTSLTVALPLDLDALTSVRGFTYDGDAYRVLTQRTGDLSITSYATFADLRANNVSDVVPLSFFVPGLAHVGGLAFDNGVYRLLLEGNVATPDADLVLLSYASFDDLVANNRASRRDLSQDIAAGYAVHGFEFEPSVMGPGPGVPEPATWAMLILGFGVVGGALRRRNASEATLAPVL